MFVEFTYLFIVDTITSNEILMGSRHGGSIF